MIYIFLMHIIYIYIYYIIYFIDFTIYILYCTVSDRHLEYEKSFTRDRIRSTDTVLKANASGVRIWHKCS